VSALDTFAISVGGSRFDNHPKLEALTWPQFAAQFAKYKRSPCTLETCAKGEHAEKGRDGKPACKHKDVGFWVPATFEKGRKQDDVKNISFLVVDADHLPDQAALDAVLAKLEPYRYVAHATHSDKPGNRCARIFVPLSKPVGRADWKRFWPAAMISLGMPADPSCCDAGRLYYWPSRPSDAEYWSVTHDGESLDVVAIAKTAPAEAPTIADSLVIGDGGVVGAGKRHAMLISIAGALRARGAAQPEIHAALVAANKRCNPPKSETELEVVAKWASEQSIGEKWKTPPPADDSASSEGWPTPEAVGDCLPSVPIFEPELLPFDLRAWVSDIANRMQVPIDLPAIYAMCALSVVATGARSVHPKRYDPWRVYPILWGIGIAPPSSMKTPSMKAVIKPLEMLEARAREAFKRQEGARNIAAMVRKAKHDAIKKQVEAAVKAGENVDPKALATELGEDDSEFGRARRFITQDSTTEKIQDLVDRGKGRSYPLGIVRDELLGLLHTFEREGRESDRTFYLEGWGVANKAVDRIGRGEVFTKDLALVVFGSTTPGPFQGYVREACKSGGGADGLLQRFQMLVYPDPSTDWKHVDSAIDHIAERRAVALFERLAGIFEDDDDGKPPALRFCDEAQVIFDQWLGKLERRLRSGNEHQALVSHFGKYRSLMPAIALVCHLASGPGHEDAPITAWAAQTAITWCEYLEHHARRVYSIAADPSRAVAKLIEDRIVDGRLSGVIKQRVIQRQLGNYEAKDVHDAVDLLEDLGWLRSATVKPGSRGGRSSMEVIVNPKGRKP
jgi:hypothetical protein